MTTHDATIEEALAALRRGEAIGLPTETVYGLAADAGNPVAVRRVFDLKGRPADHPLIVHIAGPEAMDAWAREVPDGARALARAFWPGPLTLILRRQPHVPDEVTGGQDTVGLRCPDHPLALELLRAFGGGLAAPSANRFGHLSPTSAAHVRAEFAEAVPVVLDGGECRVGIESTIVDLSGKTPRILRPGMLGREVIEAVIGPVAEGPAGDSPRASGTLEAHYAPRTPLLLLPREALRVEAEQQQTLGKRVQALVLDMLPEGLPGLALPADPAAYAHGLYAALRELDARGANLLLAERPPAHPDWLAIHDRLRRSAAGSVAGDST
ncbi:L-threonylcarbamoyladenylate synthase [Arenimonas fontis]|uniref:Threonylcarbamoyl-AMP synthase n=1 Tax=Arenimonas fontis TaxID=2608255 RepID=A0A5B2Z9B6_9GAMM|nr:L-threonylcarbamoyladenylate synthase [Arenimonas fontis]KAA2285298.1 threonylcarbamoyl-AMP synthase [Arenimonas fontis]